MYKFIVAVVSLWLIGLPAVYSQDRVDIVESLNPLEYCTVVVEQFYQGADARAAGYERKLSDALAVHEMVEHGLPLPKDSMWVMYWNTLNDREKEWMSKHVFEGWDKADEIFKSGVEVPTKEVEFCNATSWCKPTPLWLAMISNEKGQACFNERMQLNDMKKTKSEHLKRNDNGEYLRKQYQGG